MKKPTTLLFALLLTITAHLALLGGSSGEKQQLISIVAPASTPARDAAMSADGTLYLVREHTIQRFKPGSAAVEPVSLDAVAINNDGGSVSIRRQWLHSVAFQGKDPMLLWTAKTDSGYASFVTSLSSHETISLQEPILANSFAISPNEDFFALGGGPNLAIGIHRFSSEGKYLQSFHVEGSDQESAKLLSTKTSLFVTPVLPGDPVHEYSFTGQLQHTYNLSQSVGTGNVGAVRGAFVWDGAVHVDVISGRDHSHADHKHHGEGCKGCGDTGIHFGSASDNSQIFRLEEGQAVLHSTGEADSILYGIAPDGIRVGRSLRLASRGSLTIEKP